MTDAAPAVRLRGVGKDYGARAAVGAIDLEIRRGECFALARPQRCGQDHDDLDGGRVVTPSAAASRSAASTSSVIPYAAKARLGLVPQEARLYEEAVRAPEPHVLRCRSTASRATLAQRIDEALDIVGLRDRARESAKRYSAA